jgi:hypothetical protein
MENSRQTHPHAVAEAYHPDVMSGATAARFRRYGRIDRAAAVSLALIAVACGSEPAPTAPTQASIPTAAAPAAVNPAFGSIIYIGLGANGLPPFSIPSSVLQMTFTVQSSTAADSADLQIDLLDASGTRCASLLTGTQSMAANVPVTFTTSGHGFVWMCGLPADTATMKIALITEPPHGSGLLRTHLVEQSLPGGYSFRAFPPDSPGGPASPPVLSMGWADNVPGCGGDCFGPLDAFAAYCGATESDGAGATVTLTISWDHDEALPRSTSIAFPTGATAEPLRSIQVGSPSFNIAGAVVITGDTVPQYAKGTTVHATAVCTAVNSRGETATKTIGLPR